MEATIVGLSEIQISSSRFTKQNALARSCEVPVLYDHDFVQSSLLPGDLGEGVRSSWGLNGRLDFQIWFKGILTEPLQHFHGFSMVSYGKTILSCRPSSQSSEAGRYGEAGCHLNR